MPSNGEPQGLAQQVLAAMNSLRSYRLEMNFALDQPAPVVIEFSTPDSYRSFLTVEGAPDGMDSPQWVAETIFVGDKSYTRKCENIDQGCGDWREGPRPAVPIPGPSPSLLPQWPLVALEMARGLQALGTEEMDGIPLVHLQGSVNHIRAIFQNQQRVFTAAGIASFGQECEAPAGGNETCRELTYEEALKREESNLSFYDQNPSTIDFWLSHEDFLLRRVSLSIPPHEPGGENTFISLEYSRFNQVEIEAPL